MCGQDIFLSSAVGYAFSQVRIGKTKPTLGLRLPVFVVAVAFCGARECRIGSGEWGICGKKKMRAETAVGEGRRYKQEGAGGRVVYACLARVLYSSRS